MLKGKSPKNKQLKTSLTVNERESLEGYIENKEELLKASENYSEGAVTVVVPGETGLDKNKIQADINRLKRTLDEGMPERVSNRERDKAVARRDEMAKFLTENVLETREEIDVTNRNHPAWITAVKKAESRPKHERYIAEYKELCRRIDPEDPRAGHLDDIRRDR